MIEKIYIAAVAALLIVGVLALQILFVPWLAYLAWNAWVAPAFDWPVVNYWAVVGIAFIAHMLFRKHE